MSACAWLFSALVLAVLAADPAAAAERRCLNKEQQRAAIQSGKAVALEPATGFAFDTPLVPRVL